MNIALDYDGTYTNDPDLWMAFVNNAIARGHQVFVVTMRYPSEARSMDPALLQILAQQKPRKKAAGSISPWVIATSREAKAPVCLEHLVEIHIWIDDNPKAVHMSGVEIWGHVSPEGQVVDPQHDSAPPARDHGFNSGDLMSAMMRDGAGS